MYFQTVFNQVLILFIPIVVGYVVSKIKLVEDSFAKNLSVFLFNITLPCTIISALQFDFEPSMLTKSLKLIIIGTVLILLSWFFGYFIANLLKSEGYTKKIIRFSLTFANFSFMGYPVAEAFLGEEGLFYAAIFSVPVYILLQSIGMMTLKSNTEKSKFQWSYIFNPPMVGVFIGFMLFILRLKLPYSIDKTISSLGSITTPLAMTLAGLVLTKAPIKSAFTSLNAYIVSILRLVVIPLIVLFTMKLFGFDEITTKLPVIITMMPIAANLIIVTTNFDGDVITSAQYVLLSTLLSLLTIPLFGMLFLNI